MRKAVIDFLNNKKDYVILTGLAAGIYPFLHYLNSRFFILNSTRHILFFSTLFLVIPIVLAYLFYFLSRKVVQLHKYSKFVLPFVNISMFSVLIILITLGTKKKLIVLAIMVSVILALLLYKYLKKIIVFQLILAFMSLIILITKYYHSANESHDWMGQSDDINTVIFKKKPNIYVIQPDGYANFSELKKGHYKFDNSEFESFLVGENFKLYNDFRSNYVPTVYSNSSIFGMKHHYYKTQSNKENETYNFRQDIVGENPVLDILKANNYKSHLFLQEPYFILGGIDLGYDYCNINANEVSYFSNGFDMDKNIKQEFESHIVNNKSSNNFYFIEKIKPWHISNNKRQSLGKDKEREAYLNRLVEVNTWLIDMVTIINKNDPNSLIVIIADHGGFVGYDYELESRTKSLDRDLVHSVFTSALAIKWPDNDNPNYDNRLKSSVNLFRILFSYLSNNDSYLQNLQEDKSYLIIEEGAPNGVYEVIDDAGEVVFKSYK
ncbi:hypothetical protein WNY78_09820 [Psychroserpens sp. AS72]|uniref:hypothetical protein n=1 Tax=Psychroserpens sp. AS72 TaxID=3135775 RepID=UPI0031704EC4